MVALVFLLSFCARPPHLTFRRDVVSGCMSLSYTCSARCRMDMLRLRPGAEWLKCTGGYVRGWRLPHVCSWLAGGHRESRALEADICDSSYWRRRQQNPGNRLVVTHVFLTWFQSRGHLVVGGLMLAWLVELRRLYHH
jgi:hypothetical protein